jgi:RND family efflux transporter MFP subunit
MDEGAVPVKTATLASDTVDEYSDYIATIRSRQSVEIRPQVDGYVSKIAVKPGEVVSEGALLIQIDPKRQQATTNSAVAASGIAAAEVERGEATLAQLEATRTGRAAALKLAEEDHRRAVELKNTGAIAQQAVDQSTAALDGARADLTAADRQIAAQKAGISSAQKSLAQTQAAAQAQTVELQFYRVGAPFAGTVGDVPVKVGDLVTPQTLLTTVDDPTHSFEAYVSVPVEESTRLKTGLEAKLLDGSSNVIDHGKVTFVSPRIDVATQSVLVKVALEAQEHKLRAQQFLRARIIWGSEPGLRVPLTSLSRLNGQSFAFVVKDGPGGATAAQVPVKLGEVQGNDVIVKDGLKAGDRVVLAGIQKLRNGARVALEKP